MKTIVILATVLAVVVAIPADLYNSELDNINAKEIVESSRLLTSYGNCFLEKGPCTSEGIEIRKIIPDALRTNCAKCSPKQSEAARIIIRGYQTKLPELWKELLQKEDPKGEFNETLENFLNSSN